MSAVEQRVIPFGRPWILDEDRTAVASVLQGHVLTHGPECALFEQEFAAMTGGESYCVTVSSCMAALQLCYAHFGIGRGDEVIVSALTHAATAHAVELAGATPVFADVNPSTGNIDPGVIGNLITARTKAIAIVHLVGIPCDMLKVLALADAAGLKVFEDCAIALGATLETRHVGLFGDAGCFSFYPVKHITTGEGGMFMTRHKSVAQAVARRRAFGVDRHSKERQIPGIYDVPEVGTNYRMSEMQAALGRSQLKRLPENLRRRRTNFERLKSMLADVSDLRVLDATAPGGNNSHYCLQFVLGGGLAGRRDDFVRRINAEGVGTSLHYPHPVPRLAYYRNRYSYDPATYRHAAALSDGSVALPVGPHITDDDVDYMAGVVTAVARELKR